MTAPSGDHLTDGRDRRSDFKLKLRLEAKRLYDEQGLTQRQVAKALGVSRQRVAVLLRDAGATMRPVGRPRKAKNGHGRP